MRMVGFLHGSKHREVPTIKTKSCSALNALLPQRAQIKQCFSSCLNYMYKDSLKQRSWTGYLSQSLLLHHVKIALCVSNICLGSLHVAFN